MKIKELPSLERPYEKLETYGAKNLSLAELLAIIIKTGTKRKTAIEIAQDLLKEDTNENGISFLDDFSIQELMRIEGIGRIKAIELKAVCELIFRSSKPSQIIRKKVSSPEEVYNILKSDYKNEKKEIIKTVLLDSQNKIIKIVQNVVGSGNCSYVDAKEIFKEPVKVGASKIILVHNHPSGDSKPSSDDISITKKMKNAGLIFGINVVDHIIIGDNEFSSIMRLGKI